MSSYTNSYFRGVAKISLVALIFQVISPIISISHAVNIQYYVDATNGNDANPGTSTGAPWQTLARVNAEVLQPDDHVSFLCGESWAGETLDIQESGNVSFPIVFDSYSGGTCGAKPIIGGATIGNVADAEIDGLSLLGTGGPTVTIGATTSSISIKNSDFTHGSGNGCIEAINSTGLSMSGNTFSLCSYAFSGAEVEGALSYNTFSGMTEDAVQIVSTQALTVNNNIFSNLDKGAVVFGVITSVSQNEVNNTCRSGAPGCAAIRNEQYSPLGSLYNATISENIIKNVGSGITMNNYGIRISNVDTVLVSANTVNNAEEALHIEDAKNLNIINNTLALSRARGVHVIQNATGAVAGNIFQNNSIIEKNPDYPYIEMRDNVIGGTLVNLLSADGNKFFPLFKPNTSYIRAVKHGGNTTEYDRKDLLAFDATLSRFDLFGYRAYTNTGTPTGGELLSNGSFSTDISGWNSAAEAGLAPVLTHNTLGNHIGGSLQVTPAGGGVDRLWVTHDPDINLIAPGRNFRVTGYLKSGSGNINISVFLHSASDKNIRYSDRIAETYASASGRTFSLYLQANTGATDAELTFESSNPDVSYEIDEISMVRVNGLSKNNTANEIHILSNTGSSPLSQSCPGGTCGSFIDITSVPTSWPALVSWPISIAPYATSIVTLSGGTIIYPPIASLGFTSGYQGSNDAGQPLSVDWSVENGVSQTLHYTPYDNTGGVYMPIATTGSLLFTPPYEPNNYDISISAENDAGISSSNISISVNNTAPFIFVSTITGSEDGGMTFGTLSGYDITPGDFNGFSIVTPPSPSGTLNLTNAMSGSIDFTPEPDMCGTVNFDFSASDIRGGVSSPLQQPIQITCINDAPLLLSNKTASGFAGLPFTIDIVQDTQFEDVDSLYESQSFTLNFTQPMDGVVTASGTQFEYTANPAFSGSDSFQFSVSDQSGATTSTGTVNVMITRFNNLPFATSSGYTLSEDSVLSDTLTGSDADSDLLSYTTSVLPANGILSIAPGGSFTYTPNTNYNGSDSFVFNVSDGIATATGLINLTVDPLPDAPIVVNDNISPIQDTPIFIPVMNNDSDVDGSALTLTGYTTPTLGGGTLVDTGTGFLYTPAGGYVGADSFTYQLVDDTSLLSNTATVSINVTSTNSAPTSLNVSASTNEDTTLYAPLSATDPDLDTLTYILDTGVSNGSLTLFATGGFRYIPTANYSGIDTFTYHVSDGSLTSTASTVTITVTAVNDIPTATTTSYSVTPNTPSSSGYTFTGIVTGSDIDGNPLTFTSATIPVNGVFTLSSSGYFTYTPALGYIGTDNFTFFANDGFANSTSASVSLVVGVVVVTPPPATGPGGGGGGGGGSSAPIVPNPTVTATTNITSIPKDPVKTPVKTEITDTEEDLSSAPESKPFEFVLYDPTGLLSQLLLTNRIMGSTGGIVSNTEKSEARRIVEETFGNIIDSFMGEFEGPFVLRNLLQVFVLRADASVDTVAVYDEAIGYVENWKFDEDSRLDRTKKYVLRILERNRKHYEELLYRTTLARFEEELSSATEEIENIEGF